MQIQLRNFYLRNDAVGISGARLYLNPQVVVYPPPAAPPAANATSGRWGNATLDISSLSAGEHTLWVVPQAASADPVGPATGTTGGPNRIYRGLRIQLTIALTPQPVVAGRPSPPRQARVTNALIHSTTPDNGAITFNAARQELEVRLRPVWIESPTHRNRAHTLDMIVVHRTGGSQIGPAINQFLSGGTSSHYLIDRDGMVLKMVLDTQSAGHAGANAETHWGTQTHMNARSIGIENVGTINQGLEATQYRSLIALIHALMTAHTISRHRVLGHSDVRTDAAGVLNNDRIACPGTQFEWTQLENAQPGIGLARQGGAGGGTDPLAEFFTAMQTAGVQNLALRTGDRDPRQVGTQAQPGKFGGRDRPGVTAAPIAQLQTWLAEIGYSVGPATGEYNPRTARAVLHFLTHFAGQSTDNTVNQATAALISAVRLANPTAN